MPPCHPPWTPSLSAGSTPLPAPRFVAVEVNEPAVLERDGLAGLDLPRAHPTRVTGPRRGPWLLDLAERLGLGARDLARSIARLRGGARRASRGLRSSDPRVLALAEVSAKRHGQIAAASSAQALGGELEEAEVQATVVAPGDDVVAADEEVAFGPREGLDVGYHAHMMVPGRAKESRDITRVSELG
jgi:hypothetical protein